MVEGVLLSNKEFNTLIGLVQFNAYRTEVQPKRNKNSWYAECSAYKNIPIELLDVFKMKFGTKFRIRYRGERTAFRVEDGRTRTQCHQDCIKSRADRFSAYINLLER